MVFTKERITNTKVVGNKAKCMVLVKVNGTIKITK
jgi:DNA-binding protein YbaB